MGMACFNCKDSSLGNAAEETILQIIGSMRINRMSYQEFIVIMNDFCERIIRTESSDEDTIENSKSNFVLVEEQESRDDQEKSVKPPKTRNISFKEESKSIKAKSKITSIDLINPKLKTKTNTNLLTFKINDKQSSTRVNNYKSNLREVGKGQSRFLTINFSNVTVTDSNLKTYLTFYIQEHFMDSNSVWGNFNSSILPDLTKVKIKNYKLMVMSWALGFLTDPENQENIKMPPQAIFFGLLNQAYGNNFTKANIKEFLSTYLIFNAITLNESVSKVFKSKFSTVVNGMFINVEFLQSFDFIIKEVFNSKVINSITSKLQSLIIDNREEKGTYHFSQDAFAIKEKEVFNTLICTKSLRKYIYDSYKSGNI